MEKKKILVVDDDPDFAESIRSIVENGGYQVEVAYNGQEALDRLGDFHPDLILLDVMMPVMHGHQFREELKKMPEFRDIPTILLTSVAEHITSSSYMQYDMLASDAEDYLQKPVKPKVLLQAIKDNL
jgi:two-component system alkaline phosphatase synthesis response regulator PhoP